MIIFRKLSYNKPLIDTCEAAKNVEIRGKVVEFTLSR